MLEELSKNPHPPLDGLFEKIEKVGPRERPFPGKPLIENFFKLDYPIQRERINYIEPPENFPDKSKAVSRHLGVNVAVGRPSGMLSFNDLVTNNGLVDVSGTILGKCSYVELGPYVNKALLMLTPLGVYEGVLSDEVGGVRDWVRLKRPGRTHFQLDDFKFYRMGMDTHILSTFDVGCRNLRAAYLLEPKKSD